MAIKIAFQVRSHFLNYIEMSILKANVNKKQRITKSKEEKNILVINNQKSNYKRDDKEKSKESINKIHNPSIYKENNNSFKLRIKGNNLRDVRKMAMRGIANQISNRYNSTLEEFNETIVDSLICNKNCHVVAIFKDYMIYDFVDEFLKR